MRRMTVALLAICLAALCVQARTTRGDVKPFNSAEWQTSFANAFNKRDANLVKKHLSRIYNVVGESRDDVVKRLGKTFKDFDKLSLEYNVLEVKQPGVGHAVLKVRSVMKGVPTGKKDVTTLYDKEGFDSLIFEEGQWRLFDSVETTGAASIKFGPGMELFAACGGSASTIGGTVAAKIDWDSKRVVRVGTAQSPTFDSDAWAAQVNRAWNTKDIQLIGDLYSDLYSHVGYGKSDVLTQTTNFFNQFGRLTVRYQVASFKYIGNGLVAVQASIQISAEPVGGGTSSPVFATSGYGSLINENGAWRLYATQLPPAQ